MAISKQKPTALQILEKRLLDWREGVDPYMGDALTAHRCLEMVKKAKEEQQYEKEKPHSGNLNTSTIRFSNRGGIEKI